MSILTSADRFRRELETLVEEQIQKYTAHMSLGQLESHADYKHAAGRIAGLREVFDLIEDAAHRLNYGEGEGKR